MYIVCVFLRITPSILPRKVAPRHVDQILRAVFLSGGHMRRNLQSPVHCGDRGMCVCRVIYIRQQAIGMWSTGTLPRRPVRHLCWHTRLATSVPTVADLLEYGSEVTNDRTWILSTGAWSILFWKSGGRYLVILDCWRPPSTNKAG